MRNLINARATFETTQTWKTIHTIHATIHSNKANMKGWLWRPNDIRGPSGPKVPWHLSYRWEKNPSRKLVPTGDRNQARCVIGAHATACSTSLIIIIIIREFCLRTSPSLQSQICSSAEGRSSTVNSGNKAAILPGMNRCSSFPLLSAPHSL